MAVRITQGRRVADDSNPYDLEPGDYCFRGPSKTALWMVLPDGYGEYGKSPRRITSPRWTITENEDGTVTVSPSIEDKIQVNGEWVGGWHGFLENGVWRQINA